MSSQPSIAYVIGSYPLLTTTFIDREIEVMRREGLRVEVFSLRRPHGRLSPEQADLDVDYTRPVNAGRLVAAHLRYLLRRPNAYLGTLVRLLADSHPGHRQRLKTVGHFMLGVYVTDLIRRKGPVDRVHAHFVDRAALVGLVAGRLLDVPYSATAHANDIYVDPVLLDQKLDEADFVATCTEANAIHLRARGRGRVLRLYHGLDVSSYEPAHRETRHIPLFLAVGQLKEKKGFSVLVEACRLLTAQGVSYRVEIIGEGRLREPLQTAIRRAGLGEQVALLGARSHGEVKDAYRRADVFVLPCLTGSDGDRDGIPNVILEAMASGLPVVSTRHSGIPEAVEDEVSGLLVPPGDAPSLAAALATLAGDERMRHQYGSAGRKLVADTFDATRNVQALIAEFRA